MKYRSALLYAACGVAALCLNGRALADGATATTNPPAYQTQGNQSLSQTMTGGLRVQLQGGGRDINPGTPPKLTSYGILSVSTSSVALSTLTTSPNAPAWSTNYPNGYVAIRNSINSAGVVYVCWLGGTCSASVGDPIAVGQSATRNVGNGVSPTLFAASNATVTGWE